MFRPAGFSDSDDSDQEGFSSLHRGREFSDSDQERFSLRKVRRDYSDTNGDQEVQTTIPWDTLNNNEPPSTATSDTVISDPALVPVLEKTKKYLRSTLLSHKGGVDVYQLNHDYMDLVGEGIPYAKLNFLSLESLLRSLPTVCRIWRSCGQVLVEGVAGEASQHIQSMVAMQKSSGKGKGKKRGKGGRAPMYSQSYSYMQKELDSFSDRFSEPPVQARRSSVQLPQRGKVSVQINKARTEPVVQQGSFGNVVTKDIVECGNRVVELLQGRLHGLYAAQVEKMYQKKFSESLPGDWSDRLEEMRKVVVVREGGGMAMVKCGEGVPQK